MSKIHALTSDLILNFMLSVTNNKMNVGNVSQNLAADGPFMQAWKERIRAHNFQVRQMNFPKDTWIAELQVNDTHGGVRVVFVAKDTSVLEGNNYTTPIPEGVSLQDYHDHFRHIFGDSEAPRGSWELFPSETLATIDVASALGLLPAF